MSKNLKLGLALLVIVLVILGGYFLWQSQVTGQSMFGGFIQPVMHGGSGGTVSGTCEHECLPSRTDTANSNTCEGQTEDGCKGQPGCEWVRDPHDPDCWD